MGNKCMSLFFEFLMLLLVLVFALGAVQGTTDPSDVQALQVLYTSLNSPSRLTGWTSSGGDPCGKSWKGITCQGSAVVSIDMSSNNIHDTIPYQLPPNLTSLNIANNNLSGNLPYSIASMFSLSYLNTSSNTLAQSVGDIFANLTDLATLDLSLNNFSGDLPNSFSSLSNLSTLRLQNNQLTGSLNVLDGLPLTDLNVANNDFSGWIPREISSIPNFKYDGNLFDNGPAPPPPPYTPPPPGRSHNNRSNSPGSHTPWGSDGQSSNPDNGNKRGLTAGLIIGIILGSLLVVLLAVLVLVFCIRKRKRKEKCCNKFCWESSCYHQESEYRGSRAAGKTHHNCSRFEATSFRKLDV